MATQPSRQSSGSKATKKILSDILKGELLYVLKGSKATYNWEGGRFNPSWSKEQALEWGEANKHSTFTKDNIDVDSPFFGLWECKGSEADGAPHRWSASIKSRKRSGCKECKFAQIRGELLYVLKGRTATYKWEGGAFDPNWPREKVLKWGVDNKHSTFTKDTVRAGSDFYGLWECKASEADGGPHRWLANINNLFLLDNQQ